MYPTHTGLLFTVKPFYNLPLPLSIQPLLVVLCAWWNIRNTQWQYSIFWLWEIVLYLHNFLS